MINGRRVTAPKMSRYCEDWDAPYPQQSNTSSSHENGANRVIGDEFSKYPKYINSDEMIGPKGRVPVYDSESILWTTKSNANWEAYNDFKDMAKMYNDDDPVVACVARLEADAQFKCLTGSSNSGHEYFTNYSLSLLDQDMT